MILAKERAVSKAALQTALWSGCLTPNVRCTARKVAGSCTFFRGVPACCTDFGWSAGYRGKDGERMYQRLQSCSQAGLRDAGMRVSGLYDAVFNY